MEFDKAVRKASRKFKNKTNDDDLIEFQTKDQREFWKKLGLLGLRMKDNHSYLCRKKLITKILMIISRPFLINRRAISEIFLTRLKIIYLSLLIWTPILK